MSVIKTPISWLLESNALVTSFAGPYKCMYTYADVYVCIYIFVVIVWILLEKKKKENSQGSSERNSDIAVIMAAVDIEMRRVRKH